MRILTWVEERKPQPYRSENEQGQGRAGHEKEHAPLLEGPVTRPTLYFAECICVGIYDDAKIIIPGALLLILDTGKLTKWGERLKKWLVCIQVVAIIHVYSLALKYNYDAAQCGYG